MDNNYDINKVFNNDKFSSGQIDNKEISINVDSKDETQKNEYSLYKSFKSNTALLIACISAVVTIVTGILNYTAHLHTTRYLQYWGINPEYVNIINNKFYVLVAALLFCIVSCYIQQFLYNTIEVFREHDERYIYMENI